MSLTNQLKQLVDKVANENQECAVPRKETVGFFWSEILLIL